MRLVKLSKRSTYTPTRSCVLAPPDGRGGIFLTCILFLMILASPSSIIYFPPHLTCNDHVFRCPNLLSLTLSGCGHVTDDCILLLLKNCPNLKTLKLENCVRITDRTLEAVTLYGGSLQTLHVDFCRNITQTGLERVREKCPSVMLRAERSANMIPDNKPEKKLMLEKASRQWVQL